MRTAILASLILLASTPAFADPCAVTISRAPDDVRAAIEAWVAAEPACATTADVRVVVTDDGYYLLAIGGDGTVHERVVPDAQSAGVLVASWIAADGAPAAVAPPPAPATAAPLAPTPREARAPEAIAADGDARPDDDDDGGARWLTVGPTIVLREGGFAGVRGSVDVKRWRRWSVGVTAGVSTSPDDGYVRMQAGHASVDAAYTRASGPWGARVAAGLGVSALRYPDPLTGMPTVITSSFVEVSALGSRRFGGHWAFSAGPMMAAPLRAPVTLDQLRTVTLFVGVGRAF